MISDRVLNTLEYNKIRDKLKQFATLYCTKNAIDEMQPSSDFAEVVEMQNKTTEAYKLLYNYTVGNIEFFDEITDELDRAQMGSSLSMGELLRVMRLLRSSRHVKNSILSINDEEIVLLKNVASGIFADQYLENSIYEKILSEEQMADNASEKLYQLRKSIKNINAKIRERLSDYIRSGNNDYLRDNIITIRQDRYVIPVKAEYKSRVKGLVHDQSASGSTVFIEPIEILELNNELRSVTIAEQAEVEAILSDLSHSVGLIADKLKVNLQCVSELDLNFAKATYAYKTKSRKPNLNTTGNIDIISGRHPLIDPNKVVPVNISLGKNYKYLLISGPNTGGKTVTLKLVGLFTLMAMSGMYVPAADDCQLSIFDDVFCDIGDEQSIENSLSTFSSHIKNIIEITQNVNGGSLVLIDEIGAGTDPEEGSALARAVICHLMNKNSSGIITTHYSDLKEYAYTTDGIINASMDFDPQTYAPKYKINIGTPGSSNAIEIAKRLGISQEITDMAVSFLDESKVSFENVLKEAEKSRTYAEEERLEVEKLKTKLEEEYKSLIADRKKFEDDKAKFMTKAKIESRRIVNEKEEEAEELLTQIKAILKKQEVGIQDVIEASTLKNKIADTKYADDEEPVDYDKLKPIEENKLKIGMKVYSSTFGSVGEVTRINPKKKECEVICDNLRYNAKFSTLFYPKASMTPKQKEKMKIHYETDLNTAVEREINVVGLTQDDAIREVKLFLDKALMKNLEEVKIIHGKGMKILSKAIHEYLRKCPFVKEFRFGVYGEGENGVTFVKLK